MGRHCTDFQSFPLEDFPLELTLLIIRELDQSTLATFTRTSKKFYRLSNHVLYHHPFLASDDSLFLFSKIIRTVPPLGSITKFITVDLSGLKDDSEGDDYLEEILIHCKKLKGVEMKDFIGDWTLTKSFVMMLRSKDLWDLRLTCPEGNMGMTLEECFESFPNLKKLRLEGWVGMMTGTEEHSQHQQRQQDHSPTLAALRSDQPSIEQTSLTTMPIIIMSSLHSIHLNYSKICNSDLTWIFATCPNLQSLHLRISLPSSQSSSFSLDGFINAFLKAPKSLINLTLISADDEKGANLRTMARKKKSGDELLGGILDICGERIRYLKTDNVFCSEGFLSSSSPSSRAHTNLKDLTIEYHRKAIQRSTATGGNNQIHSHRHRPNPFSPPSSSSSSRRHVSQSWEQQQGSGEEGAIHQPPSTLITALTLNLDSNGFPNLKAVRIVDEKGVWKEREVEAARKLAELNGFWFGYEMESSLD